MSLKFRRGTKTQYDAVSIAYDAGEPVWVTDDKKLYIGDGSTEGGVLVNPSITLDSEVDTSVSTAVETVVVERSRSTFEIEETDADVEIDLRSGNNFKLTATTAHTITFAGISSVSNGQSGYIIIDATGTGGSASITMDTNIFAPEAGDIEVANTELGFISYTVDGTNIYLSDVKLVVTETA